jgi:hypothetical protein
MASEKIYSFKVIGGEPYYVTKNMLCLSNMFKDIIECTKEKHITLSNVIQRHENLPNVVYHLNTDRLLSYVYKYMLIWEGKETEANYVKEEPVQTSELSHIFANSKGVVYTEDIVYIENFIQETLADIKSGKLPGYPKQKDKLSRYEKRQLISLILGELACQCDELLNMPSLANKIYAYIAVKIWNTSIVDFAEAMKDPEFSRIQEKVISEWKELNPDKFSLYAKSQTTGNVNIAPAVDLDDDLSDIE